MVPGLLKCLLNVDRPNIGWRAFRAKHGVLTALPIERVLTGARTLDCHMQVELQVSVSISSTPRQMAMNQRQKTHLSLIMVCNQTGFISCVPLQSKNQLQLDVMNRELVQFIQMLGHSDVILHCDNEPAILQLQRLAARTRQGVGLKTHMTSSVAYDHAGNSLAENAIGRVRALAWGLVRQLNGYLGVALSSGSALWLCGVLVGWSVDSCKGRDALRVGVWQGVWRWIGRVRGAGVRLHNPGNTKGNGDAWFAWEKQARRTVMFKEPPWQRAWDVLRHLGKATLRITFIVSAVHGYTNQGLEPEFCQPWNELFQSKLVLSCPWTDLTQQVSWSWGRSSSGIWENGGAGGAGTTCNERQCLADQCIATAATAARATITATAATWYWWKRTWHGITFRRSSSCSSNVLVMLYYRPPKFTHNTNWKIFGTWWSFQACENWGSKGTDSAGWNLNMKKGFLQWRLRTKSISPRMTIQLPSMLKMVNSLMTMRTGKVKTKFSCLRFLRHSGLTSRVTSLQGLIQSHGLTILQIKLKSRGWCAWAF